MILLQHERDARASGGGAKFILTNVEDNILLNVLEYQLEDYLAVYGKKIYFDRKIVMDLDYLSNTYSSNFIGTTDELMHLQWLRKVKRWLSKSDKEKQERRKSYLRTTKIQFREEYGLEYVEQSIVVVDCILEFFGQVNYSNVKYEECTTDLEKSLFRLYNMLWCEKEYILYMESPRATRIHVSMDVFKPLIVEIENTKEYLDYKLDMLFKEYEKMLDLFKTAYPR